MREVGIRQLETSLSEILREVRAGERVRVTARGRAVADIVPPDDVSADDAVAAVVAVGRVTTPTGARPARRPPLAQASSSATAAVLADRETER